MLDNSNQTQHLTDANFDRVLEASQIPVMVDFFATWCGPCKMAGPIIDKLAVEYANKVMIVKVDVDENPQTATKFGIQSIPTVLVFQKKDGKLTVVDQQIGFPGEAGYRRMLDKLISA